MSKKPWWNLWKKRVFQLHWLKSFSAELFWDPKRKLAKLSDICYLLLAIWYIFKWFGLCSFITEHYNISKLFNFLKIIILIQIVMMIWIHYKGNTFKKPFIRIDLNSIMINFINSMPLDIYLLYSVCKKIIVYFYKYNYKTYCFTFSNLFYFFWWREKLRNQKVNFE